jgi:hypothetical protein
MEMAMDLDRAELQQAIEATYARFMDAIRVAPRSRASTWSFGSVAPMEAGSCTQISGIPARRPNNTRLPHL